MESFPEILSKVAGLYAALLSFGTVVDNKIHLEYGILCQLLVTNKELRTTDNPEDKAFQSFLVTEGGGAVKVQM